jgi:hypothetical protein
MRAETLESIRTLTDSSTSLTQGALSVPLSKKLKFFKLTTRHSHATCSKFGNVQKKVGNKIEMRGLESHAGPVGGIAEGNPPRNERLLSQLSC